jgi:predicted Zn finger-like uncharacterized protein
MRITCPNCLAQYEIDADLLPADGREVQCSACDHIWFQGATQRKRPSVTSGASSSAEPAPIPDPVPEQASARPLPRPTETDNQPQPAPVSPARVPAPEPEPEPELEPEAEPAPRPAPARSLDPKVADLLRAEAAFEAEARRREGAGLEMQPDLGLLGNAPWPPRADPDADPNLQGLPEQPSPAPSRGAQALPDIDQISSSLEPSSQPRGGMEGGYVLPQSAAERQSSFLKGFFLPIAVCSVMVGLYVLAPTLARTVPALSGPLDAYAALVDGLRASIVGLLGG